MKKQRVFRRLNSYGIYALSLVIGITMIYSVAAIV
jgi:hypothetical protein